MPRGEERRSGPFQSNDPFRSAEERLKALLRGHLSDFDARRLAETPHADLVPAAVLVLLERVPGYSMVFTKRTQSVEHHKGEISFVGGMGDPGDADAASTALREAQEELGIDPAGVTLLGELEPFVTVTNFLVTPVVAALDAGYMYRPNPGEVERVLRVPLPHLRDPASWFEEDRTWRGGTYRLRSCRYGQDVIWGATSRMLQSFLALVPRDLF
jgi:8-oxo-dGTP pyrophosphatase MutT (NUDIX family)